MKHLLAPLAACAFFAAGCASTDRSSNPPAPYTDQRMVTTRPAPLNGRKADVVVRVCEVQGAAGMVSPGGAPPADARLLASVETLATFGTPFYCTLRLPEQRLELGGVVVSSAGPGDRTYRINFAYANNGRIDHTSTSSSVMLPLGETRVVMGCTNGRIITLALEAAPTVGKSPATRP